MGVGWGVGSKQREGQLKEMKRERNGHADQGRDGQNNTGREASQQVLSVKH